MMPQTAPVAVVRFHQTPITSAGKLPAIASENAQPTMARMSAGLGRRRRGRDHGDDHKQTRATVSRRMVGALGSIIL